MLWALGFLTMFIVGGLTGIFNGSAPADIYINNTYFVVAHFHYTLFSAVFFGGLAGFYFWFPKMFGRMLNTSLGHLHFWLTLVFFNVTFFPLHHLGLAGMVRRVANPLQYIPGSYVSCGRPWPTKADRALQGVLTGSGVPSQNGVPFPIRSR